MGSRLLIFSRPNERKKPSASVDVSARRSTRCEAGRKKLGYPVCPSAACTVPEGIWAISPARATRCLTGYTILWAGSTRWQSAVPKVDRRQQNGFSTSLLSRPPLPYVPVITAGWDRRPWERGQMPPEKMSVWYPDRTPNWLGIRAAGRSLDGQAPDKTTPSDCC